MNEIEQLRADLEVLERHNITGHYVTRAIQKVRDKIAELEARAADPWREAKEFYEILRQFPEKTPESEMGIKYYDHLTAEVDRLTKRVAELEVGCDILKRQHDHVFDDRERFKKRLAESELLGPANAANNIVECRDIVRRLAEWAKSDLMDEIDDIIDDAVRTWDRMQREEKGDE